MSSLQKVDFGLFSFHFNFLPGRASISNVEVSNIGSAGQADFTQRIVVKTVIKRLSFLYI